MSPGRGARGVRPGQGADRRSSSAALSGRVPCAESASFSPVVARTSTWLSPTEPRSYDCVRIIFVRGGSAVLFSEFGVCSVAVGEVAVLAPCTLCGSEPDEWFTTTTLYLDRDFLVDQVFWQYAAMFTDRHDARHFVETRYTEPAQLLQLGEERVGLLLPWLDELVVLSIEGPDPRRFYRAQSLLFGVLDVIAPYIKVTEQRMTTTQRATVYPAMPRHRAFIPLRREVRHAAELLREAPEQHWTLEELAHAVHLSPSQLGRLFVQAFGKTPIAYLTMIRAEGMADLLRLTSDPISVIARRLGWTDPEYGARQFRRSVGLSPREYRTVARRGERTPGLSPH